jgi:sulfate transport system ATP-binding protein
MTSTMRVPSGVNDAVQRDGRFCCRRSVLAARGGLVDERATGHRPGDGDLAPRRIEQIGTPHEVYERPATAFVHEFIGEAIVVPVSIENGEVRYAGQKLDIASHGVTSGAARLFIRPYDIDIVAPEHAPLNGTVKRVHGLGPARRIEVALGTNQIVEIDVPRIHNVGAGEVVGLAPRQYRLFSAGG